MEIEIGGPLREDEIEAATDLLAPEYWNEGVPRDAIAVALRASTTIAARERATGVLVGTTRIVSDRAKCAWLYDVCVAEAWRGRGLGKALVRCALDHPDVRGVRIVRLGTRDAQELYATFGFLDVRETRLRPYPTTEMILRLV